jgi:hypothetical protein
MLFFLLLFIFSVQKGTNLFLLKKSNTYKYNGFDQKYIKNETEEQLKLQKIYTHFENKKLLNVLQNENISLNTKLLLLQENRVKPSNLFAGGLMNDFDFDFD